MSSVVKISKFYSAALVLALLVSGISILTLSVLKFDVWGIDDANIFLKYAKNFSSGYGFVYNAGDEKVEGFTSMLWVLLVSIFYRISSSPFQLITIFNLLVVVIGFIFSIKISKLLLKYSPLEVVHFNNILPLVVFLVAIGPSYFTWTILTLMENGLWGLIFIGAVYALVLYIFEGKGQVYLFACIPLMLSCRPESILWIFVFNFLLFLHSYFKKTGWGVAVLFLITSCLFLGLITMFRMSYFGYPFPNTFYAKVSSNLIYNVKEGMVYLWGFISNFNPLISLILVYIVIDIFSGKNLRFNTRNISRELAVKYLLYFLIFVGLGIPLMTGGDHFGGYRFYTVLVPLFYVIFVKVWADIYGMLTKLKANTLWFNRFALVFSILCFSMSLYNLKKVPHTQLDYDFYITKDGRRTGENLNYLFKEKLPDAGVITAGAFALSYNGKTIDLMGLNNTKMAHSPGDREGVKNHAAFSKSVFYDLNPDIILPKYVTDLNEAKEEYADLLKEDNFENRALKNILNDDKFRESYAPYFITSSNSGICAFAIVNRNWIGSNNKNLLMIPVSF